MAALPIPDNKTELQILVSEAEIFGFNNGLLMFDEHKKPFLCPFTLYPRSTPSLVYQRMWDVHESMQELYAKVANDHNFLLQHLKPMANDDIFLSMLVDTLEQNFNRTDDPICLISRSDYMIHENDYSSSKSPSSTTNIQNTSCECSTVSSLADTASTASLAVHSTESKEIVINDTGYTPLQVEFNSISTGFASLSHRVQQLHHYLTQSQIPQYQYDTALQNTPDTPHISSPKCENNNNKCQTTPIQYNQEQYPHHDGPKGPADTLAAATRYMITRFPQFAPKFQHTPNNTAQVQSLETSSTVCQKSQLYKPFHVLMVVQPGESNTADQRLIQYSLITEHNISVIRASLDEIEQHLDYNIISTSFSPSTQQLPPMWKKNTPISVVYYRSCYTPRDFFMEDDTFLTQIPLDEEERVKFAVQRSKMEKRVMVYQSLERSAAVKCPNIGLHLAGTKKVQQLLTQRSVLAQFVPNIVDQDRILHLFTSIWSLQEPDLANNRDIISHAIKNPTQYVLKPMREGGGNNYYDDELSHFLSTKSDQEINAMILMQRIVPNTTTKSVLYRKGDFSVVNSVSEYGVFGGFVGYIPCSPINPSRHTILIDEPSFLKENTSNSLITLYNKPFGSLIRIKAVGVNEGGVAAGFSCLSSPLLE